MQELWITLDGQKPQCVAYRPPGEYVYPWLPSNPLGHELLIVLRRLGWLAASKDEVPVLVIRDREQM